MSQTLRPYQSESIAAVWDYLRTHDGNPCIELPTGSGKTPVLVELTRQAVEQWNGRVLILAHVKELLAQARDKFVTWWPMAPVGVYSAGLRSRDTDDQIIIAGIQSVYNRAAELGRFDLVLIDEAHLVPPDGDGMYRTLIADMRVINPAVRIVGLTATPYRLDCGDVCGPDKILTEIAYRAPVRALIDAGFLSKLRGKAGTEADVSGVHTRGGDFIPGELEAALSDDETIALACDEIVKHCADRRAIVLFCAGVKHAELVSAALLARGIVAPVVWGDMPTADRDATIAAFKRRELRALCNINVLAVGFDAPHIDAVVMLRPTQSPGMYYQQVGRGLRTADGKTDCLVLDLAGNVRRHGPIDAIDAGRGTARDGEGTGTAPVKTCPECAEILPIASLTCTACGHAFPPPPIAKHAAKAEAVSPLLELHDETRRVEDFNYGAWTKRGADDSAPRTLMVEYITGRFAPPIREWVCVEHELGSFARRKAETWWAARSDEPCPTDADEAARIGNAKGLSEPTALVLRVGAKWPEIVRHVFGGPCATCTHYDNGHCHAWAEDVPESAQAEGCEQHRAVRVPEPAGAWIDPTNDEPPF